MLVCSVYRQIFFSASSLQFLHVSVCFLFALRPLCLSFPLLLSPSLLLSLRHNLPCLLNVVQLTDSL